MQSWKKLIDTKNEKHLVYHVHLPNQFENLNRKILKAGFLLLQLFDFF
jgi:hypothetical protein